MMIAVALALLAAPAFADETLARAARELASAARAAGVRRVAVEPFEALGAGAAADGELASQRLQELLVRDGRVAAVERSTLPRVFAEQAAARGAAPRAGELAAAQAVLAGSVIVEDGRRRVLARLIDAETGEILAAAEADLPEEGASAEAPIHKEASSFFPFSRIVDGASALLNGASGGPEVEERLAGILESSGGGGERRAAAALALGRLGDSRSFGLLVFAAQDGEPAVRGAAALALGLRREPAAVSRLDAMRGSDPDWRVRDAAAAGLVRARAAGSEQPSALLVER